LADWKALELKAPGKDLLKPVRSILEVLLIFLDVLRTILNTVKVLLIDFGNPIRALVEALIKLIEELIASLQTTGVFAYYDIPNPLEDPNFDRYHGGFPHFLGKWKGSLMDQQDPNRPQPRGSSTQSGFIIIAVDAHDPFTLLERISQLLRFFSKELTKPRYAAPAGFRAFPVGAEEEDPITALADVFGNSPISAIELKWELPTTKEVPDPGFTDLVSRVGADFIPPKWLVERAETPLSAELDVSGSQPNQVDLTTLNATSNAGKCVFTVDSGYSLPGELNESALIKQQLLDETGEQVLKFDKVEVLERDSLEGLLGQLGTFRYIDRDIELDKTYFYRLRAFTGPLKVEDGAIQWRQAAVVLGQDTRLPTVRWPAEDPTKAVIMGDPSQIVSVIVPDVGDFDVLEHLKRIYQAAFSHDFHLPLPDDAEFDKNGEPVSGTDPDAVGKGSLRNRAGVLGAFRSIGLLEQYLQAQGPDSTITTLSEPKMPWELSKVRRAAARLANVVAQAMLGGTSASVEQFRTLMTGSFPKQPPPLQGSGDPFDDLSTMVFELTGIDDDGVATSAARSLYAYSYNYTRTRINLLYVVDYLNGFALQGEPPNWISVQPLRDIIPWSAQFLYDLLDKIEALLAAYSGLMKEIENFIDLLIRKIETLERFIQFLLDILNLIESLQIGAYLLSAPEAGGTVYDWWEVVDNAGGIQPSTGPGGYSAGVSFAWVATDIGAFVTAFKQIF